MYPPITLSVAMCTYNGAEYVEEQLNSILNQDMPVNEIVVCDDGSNDETLTIVRRIAKDYPNLAWNIQQNSPNLGVTKNFEKAITLCTGDIIFLSDQDDVWYKDKKRVIVEYFKANQDKNIVFTDANIVGADMRLLSEHSLLEAVLLLPYFSLWDNGLDFEILNYKNVATGATMAFRRTCICDFVPFADGDDSLLLLHDYQIVISGCRNATLGVIQKRLIDYRQHGNNEIGVNHRNWIYTSVLPHILEPLVEPRPLNKCFKGWEDGRCDFYTYRNRNYTTMSGKIKLLFSVSKYCHYYKKFCVAFILSDILYGVISYRYRKLMLAFFEKKWFLS